MVRVRSCRGARLMLSALAVAALAGCGAEADLSAATADATRPLKRYDVVQSLVSNGQVIVAGLQAGAVLVSADQGRSWRREALGPASLIGLTRCPDGSLLAVDFYRKVWHADASGRDWRSAAFDTPRVPLTVACDAQGGWWVAGTRAQIAHSTDQGANWQLTDLGEDAQITAIRFVDAQFGVATAEFGLIFVTEDGGASWAARGAMPDEFYPYDALFVSRDEGYVSGLAGQVLHTTDGGLSWTRQSNASGAPLYRLFLHDGVPHGVGAGGTVARLDGEAWRAVPYPDPLPVFFASGAAVAGQSALVAGGPGGLLRVIATPDR
ncbi:MAG: glycosyl hydrolase [Proteobacteria bacterium]|nr:MAG: glycosyl hydrolase [Pseudomonadota bacterium]